MSSQLDADDWEAHWEHYNKSAETNPAQAFRRKLIIDLLDARPGDRVLDIGSGQGDLASAVIRATGDVSFVGLELAASGVAVASAKVPAASFMQVDLMGEESLVDEYEGWANLVVCSEVLEHVDDPVGLLTAGLRHAAPGAKVVVTVPGGPRTAFDRHIGHRSHFDRGSAAELLAAAGVEVESVEAAGFPFFNLYRLVVWARGKKVIEDVSSDGPDGENRAAMVILALFDRLFAFNMRRGRLGWQLVAVGHKPAEK